MTDPLEALYEMAAKSMASQSEQWILDALGTDSAKALEMARDGRITSLTKFGEQGETWCLDGRPFLWLGPVTFREDKTLPDHVHKMVMERKMVKLP
jgi:hypothetical protein